MENKNINYLILIGIHILLGVIIFIAPSFSKVYSFLILLFSFYFIIKTKNKNNEVLYAAAYIVGSEVILRMTGGNPNHEFSKYGVILFVIVGMFYSGISKNAVPYWIFLILLIPGVIIGTQTLSLDALEIRKTISFNISGSLCLGFASLYCYNRRITIEELNNILLMMGLPILTCTAYLILYTPELSEVVKATGSNFATSGGFGPNQVSTALGLGMFIFFSRILMASRNKFFLIINIVVALNIGYRGLLTFSRGGLVTGFVMFLVFLIFLIINSNKKSRLKINIVGVASLLILFSLWSYTQLSTDGLIGKRYENKDALGRVKESKLSGREEISASEINAFLKNPFFGIGVAKGTEYRMEESGSVIASHNEITRLLAEHGSLGILMLLILILTPAILYVDNKQNLYLFCFITFWLLTINHAAMRTAAPSFVYALALLKVRFKNETVVKNENNSLYRKQII